MQVNPPQFSIFILLALIYSAVTLFIANRLKNSKSERSKLLWKFVLADCGFFIVSLLVLTLLLPQTLLTVISWIGYSMILAYVVTIEIPGFLRISKFDEKLVDILKSVRKHLVKMRSNFYSIKNLEAVVENNRNLLSKEQIGDLVNDYIELSERIRNVDKSMWEFTLYEITANINRITSKSKHPFPKMIDVISLAGFSFLIAQLIENIL